MKCNLQYQNWSEEEELRGESKQKSRSASFLLPMAITCTNLLLESFSFSQTLGGQLSSFSFIVTLILLLLLLLLQ